MSDDPLFDALTMLTTGNPSFDAIRYCPEQHVLSFHRSGMDEWVNLWLHATADLTHYVERNGTPGGTADVELWRAVHWPVGRGGEFVFFVPLRRDDVDVAEDLRDQIERHAFPLDDSLEAQ